MLYRIATKLTLRIKFRSTWLLCGCWTYGRPLQVGGYKQTPYYRENLGSNQRRTCATRYALWDAWSGQLGWSGCFVRLGSCRTRNFELRQRCYYEFSCRPRQLNCGGRWNYIRRTTTSFIKRKKRSWRYSFELANTRYGHR